MEYLDGLTETSICPECGGELLNSNGELTCSSCGLVALHRNGSYQCVVDIGAASLRSKAHWSEALIGSCILPDKWFDQYQFRLSRADKWAKGPEYHIMNKAAKLAEEMANRMGLPRIYSEAALHLFERIREHVRGKRLKTSVLLAAAFIIASRRSDLGLRVTASDVRRVLSGMGFDVKPRHILKALDLFKQNDLYSRPISASDFIDEIFSKIDWKSLTEDLSPKDRYDLLAELKATARKILSTINSNGVSSDPRVLASCAIYAAWRLKRRSMNKVRGRITQSLFARISRMAEYTIRQNFERHFLPILSIEIGQSELLGGRISQRRYGLLRPLARSR